MNTGNGSTGRRLGLRAILAFAALMATALLASVPAFAADEQGSGPQIWSDKADYSPGESVVLSGSGWAPSELVHITVNDDQGQTWRRDVDVIAGVDGALTDSFQLPEHFVATYTVTATGPLSGTATTSFTDGNVKIDAAPSGIVFQLTETLYSASSDCTGAVKSGFPKTVNADSTNGDTVGVGNNESVRLDAAANANSPNSSSVFISWTSGDPFTVIAGTGDRSICVAGFQSGTQKYVATYSDPGNVAPVIDRDNASVAVNEGETAENTGTWSDANAGDTVTLSASVGTVTKSGTNSSGTWSWSFATTDGPDENQTVTITADDGQGHVTSTMFSLTVVNVAPTVTLDPGNDLSVNEGSAEHTYSYTISDPGNDTVTGVSTSCGASGDKVADSDTNTDSAGSFACTFHDGPAFSMISASATDSDGSAGAADTQTVSVANVAPTASATNNGPISEGGSATITASQTDPGADTFTYAFDCDNDGTYGAFQASDEASCSFGADGSYPVGVKVKDDDGGVDETSTTVQVNNVAPSVGTVQVDPDEVDEGDSVDLTAPASDPGSDDATLDYSIDWGDGSTDSTGTVAAGGNISRNHTYLDDDADDAYTITVTLTDSDGAEGSNSRSVTVKNVAPTASATNNGPINEGGSATITASQTDPGTADTFTYAFDCDNDGTFGAYQASDQTSCSFGADGSYDVGVKVKDDDGGEDEASTTVVVKNVAPTVGTISLDPDEINEGGSVDLTAPASDPGSDDATLDYSIDWGDGSTDSTGTVASGASISKSHTYADDDADDTYTITVTLTDSDGAEGSNSRSVTVKNVAPTASAPADQTAEEGTSKEFDLGSFSDPGADSPWAVEVDWGDGSTDTTFNATTKGAIGSQSHTYADNGQYTVTVTVSDGDGGSDSATFKANVANVAPTASATNNGPINEGGSATITASQTDPGADTFTYAFDCDNDGTYGAFQASDEASCSFGADGSYPVGVKVKDDDGGVDETSTTVQVNNVAPSVGTVQVDPDEVDEGDSVDLTAPASDPGSDDATLDYSIDWGDGSTDSTGTVAAGGNISRSHTYLDDDADDAYTITVTLTDSDGDTGQGGAPVSVHNVAPTVSPPADQSASEGTSKDVNLGSFSDPGADSPWSVDVAWGDGSAHTAFAAASTGSLGSKPHTYADNGQYTVTVTVSDGDGGSHQATFKVDVANVGPTVSPPGDQTASEGTSKDINLGSFNDPGVDSPWAVDVDWGDGSAHTTFNATTTGSLGTKPHTYADNGQYTVTVTVTDKDGTSDSHTFKVTVANVAPTITSVAFANSSVGCGSNNATLNVTFEDPGADTWSATINWGDGSPAQTIPSVGKSFSASHTYGSSGAFAVTVTVTDDDGDSDTKAGAAQVTVQYVFEGGGILQPINPGPPSSIFRYGSTIPVKVKVRDCNGSYPGTLVLKVTFQKLSGSTPDGAVSEPYSTSEADVGNQMRFTGSPDNQYIFNMASKSMPDGTATYRITVSLHVGGVPIQSVSADIGLKNK
jgi:hypothetical protein